MTERLAATLLVASLLGGCAGVSGGTPERTVHLEETRIVARRTAGGEFELDSYDPSQLFERAYRLGVEGRCADAVPLYDRVTSEFPSSRFVSAALYNAGLCLVSLEQLPEAAERFERLLAQLPDSSDAKHAALQLASVLVQLERWEPALGSAEQLLDRSDLDSGERLESMARRAESLLGLRRIDDAERAARDALAYYRTRQGDERITEVQFAAAANFVLAETIRERSEALTLPDADVVQQREILDRRAQLLLDAQRAYFDTMRHTDARWAAAAGFRIGAMYDHLYEALTTATVPPPPRELTGESLEIYRREYRAQLAERVRPLIRHAIRYWEMTLLMIERTGVQSPWVERTRQELEAARTRLLGTSNDASGEGAARALGSPISTLAPANRPSDDASPGA